MEMRRNWEEQKLIESRNEMARLNENRLRGQGDAMKMVIPFRNELLRRASRRGRRVEEEEKNGEGGDNVDKRRKKRKRE